MEHCKSMILHLFVAAKWFLQAAILRQWSQG